MTTSTREHAPGTAAEDVGRRPRILFVINSLAGGGAERVMLSLVTASEAMRDRYDIALALLDDEPRDYQPPAWLRVHQLNCDFSLPKSAKALNALIRAERPDLTLSFLTRSNISSVAAAKLNGHRAIISERANTSGHFKPGLGGKVAKALIRLAYPRADLAIAPSQGIADDLADNFGVRRDRLRTIANPVDAARITALAREEAPRIAAGPYAVAVSRLTKSKNVTLLIEALAASGSDLSLVVLGQGSERDAVLARAAELGLADRVHLPGFAANPYAIMRDAACYLSASNGEGFPNGLVEALALGLPAVMTNCPSGPSEILDEARREDVEGVRLGRYGILTPQNDVAAMAEAIALVEQPEIAARLREAGPRRAADYSVEAARDRFWDAIETVLARKA